MKWARVVKQDANLMWWLSAMMDFIGYTNKMLCYTNKIGLQVMHVVVMFFLE